MEEQIQVSIICTAYNQEDYIRDAIESFLMQKTRFPFEVIIHDDASTDRTADIIREYEKKYPNLIKPIYQTENQYSQGKSVVDFCRRKSKGKYIAICEGDDYWTDPYKLQKQYDAMEQHPEVDMCAHCAECVEADSKKPIRRIAPAQDAVLLTTEQVIIGGGGYFATNSLFYRSSLINNTYEFRKILSMDLTFQILGSLRGGIWYLPDCMSVYRVAAKNSWTVMQEKDTSAAIAWREKKKKMLDALDRETQYKYTDSIDYVRRRTELKILSLSGKYKEMLAPKYADIVKNCFTGIGKWKLWLKAYFPWIIKLEKGLRCNGKCKK